MFLELLLGGSAEPGDEIARDLTPIEQQLLKEVFQSIARNLSAVWKSLGEIEFELGTIITDPRLSGVPEGDSVVAIEVELKAGLQDGMMNIAVPSALVKRLIEKSGAQGGRRLRRRMT